MYGRCIGIVALILSAALQRPCRGQSGPQPPCGSEPFPSYAAVDSPPAVRVWRDASWRTPACIAWAAADSATLVAVAARFRNAFGVQGLERRIGAVSRLAGLLYWSTTAGRWQPLILDAYAASSPTGARRADFSPDELVPGRNLYTQQEDNVFGKTTYCMRIASKSAARLVFTTENTSTIRLLSMPVFSPGEIQSVCFLERESGDIWRYYGLTRMGKAANLLPSARDASLINRAVASFRYLAGIPADKEPPAAR